MDVMKGFLAGMLLPILILAFLYPFSDRVRTPEDIQSCIDAPVLAILPTEINGRKRSAQKGGQK
jgi:capsular polysaccharide biosynthesis protein